MSTIYGDMNGTACIESCMRKTNQTLVESRFHGVINYDGTTNRAIYGCVGSCSDVLGENAFKINNNWFVIPLFGVDDFFCLLFSVLSIISCIIFSIMFFCKHVTTDDYIPLYMLEAKFYCLFFFFYGIFRSDFEELAKNWFFGMLMVIYVSTSLYTTFKAFLSKHLSDDVPRDLYLKRYNFVFILVIISIFVFIFLWCSVYDFFGLFYFYWIFIRLFIELSKLKTVNNKKEAFYRVCYFLLMIFSTISLVLNYPPYNFLISSRAIFALCNVAIPFFHYNTRLTID